MGWGGQSGHMQAGIGWRNDGYDTNTASINVYIDFYVKSVGWGYNDNQVLNYGGSRGGSFAYNMSSPSGGTVEKYVGTAVIEGQGQNYNGGPVYSASCQVTGAYDGSSPSHYEEFALPARPANVPTAPGLGVDSVTVNSARIVVSASDGRGAGVDWYGAWVTSNNAPPGGGGVIVSSAPGGTFTATGLNAVTTYYAWAQARNGAGYSALSGPAGFTTGGNVPNQVAAPGATAITTSGATISWATPGNGGSAITAFEVQTSPVSDFSSGVWSSGYVGGNSLAWSSGGTGTRYYIRVRAFNGVGPGVFSPTSTFATLSTVPTIISPTAGSTRTDGQASATITAPGLRTNRLLRVQWTKDNSWSGTIIEMVVSPVAPNVGDSYQVVSPTEYLGTGVWYLRARIENSELGQTTAWTSVVNFNESHAPTVVQGGPLGGTYLTYGTGNVSFTFTPIDSAPTDTMSAYRIIVERADTGAVAVDTTKTITSFANNTPKTVTLSIPNTFKDLQLRWRVAVWDANDTAGAFSINAIFYMVDIPTVTMTSPVSPVSVGSPTVTWTFAATLGRSQARADVKIVQTETGQIAFQDFTTDSAVRSITPTTSVILNGKNYYAEVKVTDSVGKITTVTTSFVATFNPPAILRYDVSSPDINSLGYVLVDWSNATADAQLVAWRVYRRETDSTVWDLIAEYTDQSVKQHKDFLIKSYETYIYSVTQVANRFGSNLESPVGLVIKQNTLPTRTNLATNPSMEGAATPSTFAVRTNFASVPDGRTYVTATGPSVGWSIVRSFGTTGTGTYTSVTGATDGPLPTITGYARKTWTAAATGTNYGFETNQMNSFVGGTYYTVSAWVRSTKALASVGFKMELRDGTGVFKSVSFATTTLVANVWTRVSAIMYVPSSATTVKFILDVDGASLPAVSDKMDVTGLLVEYSSVDTRAAIQRTNYHTNPSVGRATTPWTTSATGGAFTVTRETTVGATTGIPAVGNTWYKALSTTAVTSATINIATGATGTSAMAAAANTAHNISAYAVSSYTGFTAVRLDINWYNAAGGLISTDTTGTVTYPTANAWVRVSRQVTSPALTAFVQVNVVFVTAAGLPIGGYVGATGVLVERVGALGAYFDGSTMGGAASEYEFSSTVFASTSTVRPSPTPWVRPYFDGTFAPIVKANLIQNPSAELNATLLSPLQCTVARTTLQSFSGTASFLTTATSTGVNGQISPTVQIPVVPGRSYVASGYVRAATLPRNVNMLMQFRDAAGSTLYPGALGSDVTSATDGWTRFVTPALVAPANAAVVYFTIYLDTALNIGDVQYLDGLMIEDATDIARVNPSEYFDGSTTAVNLPTGFKTGYKANWVGTAHNSVSYISDADFTPTWAGTAFASISTLAAATVAPDFGDTDNPVIQSSRWSKNVGGKSARIIPAWPGVLSDVFFAPLDFGGMGGMVAGKTYSLRLTMRLEAPQTGTLDTKARTVQLVAFYSGIENILATDTAPNVAGEYEFVLSWTLPSNTTSLHLDVHGGADVDGGDVWVDWLLIEEASVPGPYFDGYYTPDPTTVAGTWSGTPNASTSVLGEIPYTQEYRVLEIFHEYYWIVVPDEPDLSMALPGIKGDSNTLEFEEATYNVIGRGRHRDYGDRLGYNGSLTVQVRQTGITSEIRRRVEELREAQETYWLRTPFGKLFPVALGDIGWVPLAGVGKAEMGELTIPYEEVS